MTAPTLEQVLHAAAKDWWRDAHHFTGREVRLVADALAAVTAERDQARQKLAGAPHDYHCHISHGTGQGCDCWKAGL